MNKKTIEAQKLADKIVGNCMESPLSLDLCMTVLAQLIIDFTIEHGYPMDVVLQDMDTMHKMKMFSHSKRSGAVH